MDLDAHVVTVGFPRMHKEPGERRDFLPDLIATVARAGADVVVEEGIGSGMGLADIDYTSRSPRIVTGSNVEAFAQDIVVTLRCPETDEFKKVGPGASLVAMLHYPTRPARITALHDAEIEAVSLDGIVDDAGRRLVVNARGVAWNGLEAAFDVLEATWPPLRSPRRGPVQVLVMGIGTIGRHAVEAASKFGNQERCRTYMAEDLPGVVVRAVGRTVTDDEATMRDLFSTTDVLVDASQRDEPWRPLVPNRWLAALPSHAVVCDLVVDPYLMQSDPGIWTATSSRRTIPPGATRSRRTSPPSIVGTWCRATRGRASARTSAWSCTARSWGRCSRCCCSEAAPRACGPTVPTRSGPCIARGSERGSGRAGLRATEAEVP
jgi:alanine dehydrogenase